MSQDELTTKDSITCRNCETVFSGNFCPNCGQSTKEFAKPFRFLIIDLVGNVFAFDTRFWKTFIAVLFKPGALTLDFVKGHRVKYMPPFRFFIFVSFFFFFFLNYYSNSLIQNRDTNMEGVINVSPEGMPDSLVVINFSEEMAIDSLASAGKISDKQKENVEFLQEHPEIFIEKFYTYFSWVMFLLIPFYALLLLLFFRKRQKFYATHFVFAINQHAFAFVLLLLLVILSLIFTNEKVAYFAYLALLIPIYQIIGFKKLYQQKLRYTLIKFFTIIFIYTLAISLVTVMVVFFTLQQTGFDVT